ncbi:MAG: GntR family transcriptional regulator [Armatimonadota bacterium]|nr:GntR family transcriptional regulator [Armatimonadota bacterium]MDR7486457.1 GntR family transcriptional regulator [Armatimonadota bacterium]MDR7532223.1 GntR family transcriptional regulator [Armatimonadota bacterium]MDR7537202.1 GntR family transcriptional regulator [Armatimonadota bacterium]
MSDLLTVENVPTRELVLRKLRDAILAGRFQPGDRLVERELVERMGVSRTPIREALRMLELEGLVTTIPYRGPVVTRPTLEDAQALYEVRAALEGQAVALFTRRADAAAIERLRGHLAAAEAAWTQGDIPGVVAANNAFHDELAAGCGNALLQALLANLRARIVLLRVESLSYPGRPPHTIAEHKAIVRHIARREAAAAKRLNERHIMHAWRAARAQLQARRPSAAASPAAGEGPAQVAP